MEVVAQKVSVHTFNSVVWFHEAITSLLPARNESEPTCLTAIVFAAEEECV